MCVRVIEAYHNISSIKMSAPPYLYDFWTTYVQSAYNVSSFLKELPMVVLNHRSTSAPWETGDSQLCSFVEPHIMKPWIDQDKKEASRLEHNKNIIPPEMQNPSTKLTCLHVQHAVKSCCLPPKVQSSNQSLFVTWISAKPCWRIMKSSVLLKAALLLILKLYSL